MLPKVNLRSILVDDRKVRRLSTKVMLLILVAATVYWLWIGLAQRSVIHDEAISLMAVAGILDYGYPRGYKYPEGRTG